MLARHARSLLGRQYCGLLAAVPHSRGFSSGDPSDSDTFDALVDTSSTIGEADAVVGASQAAEAAALFAAKGECWQGTQWAIDLLTTLHDGLHMPWWGAIAAAALVGRAVSLPITVTTQRLAPQAEKMKKQAEQFKELHSKLMKSPTPEEFLKMQQQMQQAQEDIKKHRSALFLPPALGILNAAVLISQFSAVSTLAAAELPSLTTGGLAWFTNLTLPDPYLALPAACALSTLVMAETGAMAAGSNADPDTLRMLKRVGRMAALITLPMGYYVSSAVCLMWFSSGLLTWSQGMLLSTPAVRQGLGLPQLRAAAATAAAVAVPTAAAKAAAPAPAAAVPVPAPAAGRPVGLPVPPPPGSRPRAAPAAGDPAAVRVPPPPGSPPTKLQ